MTEQLVRPLAEEDDQAPVRLPLTEKQIVDQILEKQKACEDALRPLYDQWDINWRLYHNRMDFKDKADWQSKQVLSEVFPVTERACGLLKRALTGPGNWFSVEVEDETVEAGLQAWLDYHLNEAGFANAFRDAAKNGILSSLMIFKIWSGGGKRPLRVKAISPYDFWVDPTGLNRFAIERVLVTRGQLESWARLTQDRAGGPLYVNLERLDEARLDRAGMRDVRWMQRTQLSQLGDPLRRGVVELLEYWGDFEDSKGRTIGRNLVAAVANRDVLVRYPRRNPFAHGSRPYTHAGVVILPDSPYGKSLIEAVTPTVICMTEILNLVLDSYMLAALPIAEADTGPGGIDPHQLDEGLRPGMILERRMAGANPALRPVKAGMVDMAAVPILQFLDRVKQRNTSVTDPIQGLMVSKRGTTATEVATTSQAALSLFDNYASDIEGAFLEPALEQALKVVLQHATEVDDPWLRRRFEGSPEIYARLAALTPKERVELLEGEMRLRVHGISSSVQKLQSLQRLERLMVISSRLPPVQARLKFRQLLERFLDALELDSGDLLRPEAEARAAEAQLMMSQRGGAGAMPGGPGPQAGGGAVAGGAQFGPEGPPGAGEEAGEWEL